MGWHCCRTKSMVVVALATWIKSLLGIKISPLEGFIEGF